MRTLHMGHTLDDRNRAIAVVGDVLAVLEYTGTSDGSTCENPIPPQPPVPLGP